MMGRLGCFAAVAVLLHGALVFGGDKAQELPPLNSAHALDGELVSADFIHRSGQFRESANGTLHDFTLPPYGAIRYLEAEADLRDVPLGTALHIQLVPDAQNELTRAALIEGPIGKKPTAEETEKQRKKFYEFNKKRGLPGWIDKTDGNTLTVTLFSGDAANFKKTYMDDFAVGKDIATVVANDELRTWNPGTDKEKSQVLEIQEGPQSCYGSSGVRLVVKVNYMLEGFRKGRCVRLFGAGWPVKDTPYGESLMGYGYGRLLDAEIVENTAKEYPALFPFRTDFSNRDLPWYQLKSGEIPPPFAEHVLYGELVKADAAARTGQVLVERTGKPLDFTLIPQGTAKALGADATLADIPAGTRCRLNLFQDEKGAFTQASLIQDDFSYLSANALTYRIEAVQAAAGKLLVARQLPEVKNYNGDMEKPNDIARCILNVSGETRVWKGGKAAKIEELAPGDSLLVNLTGELPGKPSRCTEIWVGEETHKALIELQKKKHVAAKK